MTFGIGPRPGPVPFTKRARADRAAVPGVVARCITVIR
jgi:hypothetical protein